MTDGSDSQLRTHRSLHGQQALVIGLGREGRDLARFLAGAGARVRVTDARPESELRDVLATVEDLDLHFSLGGHDAADLNDADVVYVSPGVPPEIPFLRAARQRGVRISSATELFFSLCPGTIVGITGSSGKSTTTAMLGNVFQAAGRETFVGGNIGVPVLGLLEKISRETWVVMELSSFQLEFMQVSPPIATITNITPNHLDRHPSMDAYRQAKEQIMAHQDKGDWAITNHDDTQSKLLTCRGQRLEFSLEETVTGAFVSGEDLVLDTGSGRASICSHGDIALRGEHNVANALAVIATSAAAGVSESAMRDGIRSFRALPHRLEPVETVRGVTYYNDSIATSPERSIAALLAFREPVVLLAGGRDKHLPLDRWAELMCERVSELVVFGEAAPLIEAAARQAGFPAKRVCQAGTLDQAVHHAAEVARPGDAVLLSPGCTSYDAFFDFEARGERFRELVRDLARRQK